jgi:hypothetical protein
MEYPKVKPLTTPHPLGPLDVGAAVAISLVGDSSNTNETVG